MLLEPCNSLDTAENLLLRGHLETFDEGDEALGRITEIAKRLTESLDKDDAVFEDGEVIVAMEMRFHNCDDNVELDAHGDDDDWLCSGMTFSFMSHSSIEVLYQYRLSEGLREAYGPLRECS